MMSEDGIRSLVMVVDQRQAMTDDERDRVRARLGLEPTSSSVPEEVDPLQTNDELVVDATVEIGPGFIPQRRRARKIALMAAAIFVVLAGIAFASRGTEDSGGVATITDGDSTIAPSIGPSAGSAFCTGVFADFVVALNNWRGIDNWSRLVDERDPEPHLPTFADAVLRELDALLDDPTVTAQYERLTGEIAELDELVGSSTARDQRRQAIENVVSFVAQAIDSDRAWEADFSTCDVDGLVSAAAGSEP